MNSSELLAERWSQVMMDNYGRPGLALVSGSGVRLRDADGNEYLDFVAGIAVSALGHAHPALVAAVSEQAARLVHTSNLFLHEPGIALAEKLVSLTGSDDARVFFANDGATANECALKIARLHGRHLDPAGTRLAVVAAGNGFHGRSLGALAVTGNPAKREPFAPLPGPVRFVSYGDVTELAAAIDDTVAAVILEPTQGEGGLIPAPEGYLAAARRLCTESGALLIVDEVQSGIGRTGHWFASLAAGVKPDVLTLAKGLGGGLPIGACIGFGPAGRLLGPGSHGSTFGGNPIAASAALAVLNTIENEHLLARVERIGAELRAGLEGLIGSLVTEVRGSGLWLGLQLARPAAGALEAAARDRGLLVNAVRPDVIRLAPPLIVDSDEVTQAVAVLAAAVESVTADSEQVSS